MRSTERNLHSSVLGRAVALLDAFSTDTLSLSLAELSHHSQLPKATVHRLAAQLVELGLLDRHDSSYRLGLRLFELGSSVARQRRLRDTALPIMQDLYEATHETVHLGFLDDLDVVYLEKITGSRAVKVNTRVGVRRPLHCTGLGKAILANSPPQLLLSILAMDLVPLTPHTITTPSRLRVELERVRASGVAYDRDEHTVGVTCIAAPLVDRDSYARVAISLTGPSSRFNPDNRVELVKMAALTLTRALHGHPWPN